MTPDERREYLALARVRNPQKYTTFIAEVMRRSGLSRTSVATTLHNPKQSQKVWAAIVTVAREMNQ